MWRTAGRIALAALCAYGVWRYIDLKELASTLQQVTPGWVVMLLALATLDRLLMAYKWRHLLLAAGAEVSLGTTANAYYQAAVAKWLLPTSVGMDALRGVIVAARTQRPPLVLGVMLVEKALGSIAAIALGSLGLGAALLVVRGGSLGQLSLITLFVCGVTVLGLQLSLHVRLMTRLMDWLPARCRGVVQRAYHTYSEFRHRPKVLYRNLLLCVLEQGLQIGIIVLCAVALNLLGDAMAVLAGVCIAQAIKKFALLAEGWMLGEVTMVVVCSALGTDPGHALAFSLLWKMTSIVASAPGLFLFVRSGGCVAELRQLLPSSITKTPAG